ncbi:MAG: hypothetical protein ACYDER_07935 [Ktedonobacteraceae bacterium]
MQAKLYAENYQERREEVFLRSAGRCEHILPGGERCPTKLGDWRITRSKQVQFEQLLIHHPNGDPENPDAEMLVVCWACHMRLHRQPGPGRPKASARKQGYEVIRVPHLMGLLARVGLSTWVTTDGRVGWQMSGLAGEASDPLDALFMALHWLNREVSDLQGTLFQAQAENRQITDRMTRMQCAEQRRLMDAALRNHA